MWHLNNCNIWKSLGKGNVVNYLCYLERYRWHHDHNVSFPYNTTISSAYRRQHIHRHYIRKVKKKKMKMRQTESVGQKFQFIGVFFFVFLICVKRMYFVCVPSSVIFFGYDAVRYIFYFYFSDGRNMIACISRSIF